MNLAAQRQSLPRRAVVASYRSPVRVLIVWSVLVAIAGAGILRLQIDTATSSFLDRSAPEWATYERSIERHGTDELLVVALEYSQAWPPRALVDVVALTDAFERVPGVRRVDSLATVPLIRDEDGALRTDSGLALSTYSDPEEFDRYRSTVEADRIASKSLVSENGKLFAINILLEEKVDQDPASLVRTIRDLTAGYPVRISGVPVFRSAVNTRTRSELFLFVPLTLVLLGLCVAAFLPRAVHVLSPLIIGGAAATVSLGAMGYLAVELSLSTIILPSVIVALGCAYAMHVVAAEPGELNVVEVADAIALSGVTSTIGFLAMATVPVDAIRELATFGALGVAVATAGALTLAPAIRSAFSGNDSSRSRLADLICDPVARKLAEWVSRRRPIVISTWAVFLAASLVGLSRLEIATDIILWFPEDDSIRTDYEEIRDQLSGITPVNVLVEPVDRNAPDLHRYSAVRAIDDLTAALAEKADVGKALSIGDPLRLVRGAFSDDGRDELPASDPEIEQALLFLSGMDRLDDVLHPDRRSANIVLRLDNNSSDDIVALDSWIRSWWARNGDDRFRVATTGIMYEFGRAEEAIAAGQIVGLALAVGLVSVVLLVALRRIRLTAIALSANLVPIAIGFGTLGLIGVNLDAATACLGSMALGIAVDDSIHFVSGYRDARLKGCQRLEATVASMRRVLLALVMTTAAITVGFGVLVLSDFTLIRNLGLVTAYFVSLCLAADVVLLPALLMANTRKS